MGAKIIDILSYSPRSDDLFFFDNNIWMYLFCPLGNYYQNKQDIYSSFLESTKTANSTIFINSMVLSEFSNSYLRMDFELWKNEFDKPEAHFKRDFVGSKRYQETVKEIGSGLRSILKFCERTTDSFNAVEMSNILHHFEKIDFNDSYYLELSRLNKWKIVTDDQDFVKNGDHEVDIITIVN